MKKYLLFLTFLVAIIPALMINAQSTSATKTKLFSISAGEKPVYSECTIFLSSSGSSASLLTTDKNNKYYFYDKGTRKGPFEDSQSTGWHSDEDADNMNTSIYYDNNETNLENFLSYTNEGKTLIKAGGKTYGPFDMVLHFFATKDGKMTAAVISDDNKYKLITTSGTSIALEGLPSTTCISPSGKIVIIVDTKEYDPSKEFMNIDASKLTMEQIAKLAQEIEEKQKKAPAPEAFLYLNDGKKFGPYPKDSFSGNNPAFSKTGGENWFMTIGSKLYVNGIVLADLGSENISNDDIWLSSDGKRYAIKTYDNIKFSDGSVYNFPLMIKLSQKDGKTWITWVSLENERDVILYSKPL